jgi:N-acetylglucosamine malate deacetylase 1
MSRTEPETPPVTEPLDVLAVFAHPDDAELLCGGTLARCVDLRERVGILDLTAGEMGSRGTAEIRAREGNEAARILGVPLRRSAGLPDGTLEPSLEARAVVAACFRELRPRVLVTHWLEGRHPDHRAAARLVLDAAFIAGLRNAPVEGDPFRPHKVVHAIAFREDAPPPSFVVDITDQMDRKIQALECFESQFQGARAAGEVFPGGERPLMKQVRTQMAWWGSRIRTAYGEPFWCREAVEVDSLGGLRVSTF